MQYPVSALAVTTGSSRAGALTGRQSIGAIAELATTGTANSFGMIRLGQRQSPG
jgi:hypothetical protein